MYIFCDIVPGGYKIFSDNWNSLLGVADDDWEDLGAVLQVGQHGGHVVGGGGADSRDDRVQSGDSEV